MDNNPTPPLETPDAPDKEKMDQVSLRPYRRRIYFEVANRAS